MTTVDNSKIEKMTLLDLAFIAFCMLPFVFPNPIVVTNIQPYAAMLGTCVLLYEILIRGKTTFTVQNAFFITAWLTLLAALIVLIPSGLTVLSFRAVFNYYSVAIIPSAMYRILCRLGGFPEKLIRCLILVWFFVSSVQFFVSRGFMTGIIGGVRYSEGYRGVVGLASEPSFLGIACFYFLHLILKFREKRAVYLAIVLVMGVVYAQSMMGVLFILTFIAVYMLDVVNTRRGYLVWAGAVIAAIAFWILLNTVLTDSRLYQLIQLYAKEGVNGILGDVSAGERYSSLTGSIRDAFEHYLLPMGYTQRIGSGYGGFLCELGFLALPILGCISRAMSLTFQKKVSQILYFVLVTVLLFNSTQIGNPLLLTVIAWNLFSVRIPDEQKGARG